MNLNKIWLLAVALAASFFMLPGLSDPYYMPRLALLLLLAIPLLLRKSARGSNMEFEILVALMCWIIAAACSQDRLYSVFGSFLAPFDSMPAALAYAGLALGVAGLEATAEDAAWAVTAASIPLSIYAIAQRLVADPLLVAELPTGHRVVASQGWPVYLGAVLAISAACAIGLLQRRREWLPLAGTALAFAIPAIWFTGTRGALIAVAAAAFFALPKRLRWGALLALPIAYLARHNGNSALSDLARLENYKAALMIWKSHPFVGIGPGTYSMISRTFISAAYIHVNHSARYTPQHAHNQVLQVLACGGLVGLLGYVTVLLGCWRNTLFSADRAILVSAGAAYAVVACLNPIPHSVTALMVLVFAAASSREYEPTSAVTRLSLAAACLAGLVASSSMVASDHYMRVAARQSKAGNVPALVGAIGQAYRFNPWELRIRSAQVDADQMLHTRDGYAAGIEVAHHGVLMHPLDSSAHEIYGRAVLLGAMAGLQEDPREALLAFNRAQELAPTFMPLMYRRRSMALGLHMPELVAAADAEIKRTKALED